MKPGDRLDPDDPRIPADAKAAARAADPRGHLTDGRVAHRRADGMPPPELIEEFLADARSEGCVCNPEVNVTKSAFGGGGIIGLLHQPYCPLIRVLDEQAKP